MFGINNQLKIEFYLFANKYIRTTSVHILFNQLKSTSRRASVYRRESHQKITIIKYGKHLRKQTI